MSGLYLSLAWFPWLVDVWRGMAAAFGHSDTLISMFLWCCLSLWFFHSHFFLPASGGSSGCLLIFFRHSFELNQFINLLFFFVSLVIQFDEGQVRHYNSGRSAGQWRTGEGRKVRKDGSWEMLTGPPHFGSGKLLIQNYVYAVVWDYIFWFRWGLLFLTY